MSGTDFLGEATAELYGLDPEVFTERRAALAAQARAAGDRPAAKAIAGLRKPTRPAWMINQLVRADPGVGTRLTALGDELRAAASALDGARIRELSQARRRLIDTLIRQALQQAGERSPSAALREDLTATFGAALADPQVAGELAAGTLLRGVHRADFSTGIPGLTLVPPPVDEGTRAAHEPDAAGKAKATRTTGAAQPVKAAKKARAQDEARDAEEARAARDAGAAGKTPAAQEARAAETARAEEVRAARRARAAAERRQVIAEAEQALAEATQAADQAAQDERDGRDHVRALESELDEARRRLTEARRRVRETQSDLQKARRALSPDHSGPGPARQRRGST
ncbi:MAG: hypothetical protein ABR926_15125 [Streptosporangiaceae bacterium]